MNLQQTEFLILDLQTTGMRPSTGHVLEMAWALGSAGGELGPIEAKLIGQPEGAFISRRVTELTGIRPEDMASAVTEREALELLKQSIRPYCLIHYAQFEKPFLQQLKERVSEDCHFDFEILCTHQIARRLVPDLPTKGMRGLAGYFGVPLEEELKRAGANVQATWVIWRGLVEELAKIQVLTVSDLQEWLKKPFKAKRRPYQYPIERLKRLELPEAPGVYRMVAKNGCILYVGKATSLKSRVNSYFRGQKGRDRQKLEMLTQVWDLKVTVCKTPLEAALLESDEIKRLNPPYNISLKTGLRRLVFFARDFASYSYEQSPEHPMGPYAQADCIFRLKAFAQSWRSGVWNPAIFYEPLDPELMAQGFTIFCSRYSWDQPLSLRQLLAFGLHLLRQERGQVEIEEESLEGEREDDEEVDLTPEQVADKFARFFKRAGCAHQRALKVTWLLNSDIYFAEGPEQRQLSFRQGQPLKGAPVPLKPAMPWADLNIETYDRMRVLQSELSRVRKQNPSAVHVSRHC